MGSFWADRIWGLRQRCGDFSSYWTFTETYDALKIYMDMDFDGLKADIVHMLGGGHIRINTRSFQNDMRTFHVKDDVLTLLIHLGYLAYDSKAKEAFIPNKEIIGEFENAMSVGGWPEIMRILKASEQLLEDTISGNEEKVAEGLDKELPTGRGFADIVFLPLPSVSKPALVVELKYDKTAYAAIRQIKERHYIQALEGYRGDVLLVGINYDKESTDKPHSCVIEKYKMESDNNI